VAFPGKAIFLLCGRSSTQLMRDSLGGVAPAMRSHILLLLVAEVLALAPKLRAPQRPFEGTYRLLVCRGGCGNRDSSRAYVQGILVFTDSTFGIDRLPAEARRRLEFSYMFMGDARSHDNNPNGCFVLKPRKRLGDSYLAIETVGLLKWRRTTTGMVSFDLYHSPDAGYSVTLAQTAANLAGSGTSWGAGVVEIHAPDDSIVAWRLGPSTLTPCIQAASKTRGDSA
jgi:hypothetical protein